MSLTLFCAFAIWGEYRKTGVTLSNTGEKDAQGFQPLQDLFSSPEKEPSEPANRVPDPETEEEDDDDDAGSEDMEIASSTFTPLGAWPLYLA